MKVADLEKQFAAVFQPEFWSTKDSSLNGLQCGCRDSEVTKVAFAVDACRESFERAVDEGAQALFVHHGLFWGKVLPLTGTHYDRIAFLVRNNIALFAYHLPLDAHPELGNNFGIARSLGLQEVVPFGSYKGTFIGCRGRLPEESDFQDWLEVLSGGDRKTLLSVLAFGKKRISTIGIVSGGAPFEVEQAMDAGLDAYITGDAQHAIYHLAQEGRINVVSAGHYATEIWGVRQTSVWTRNQLGLDTVFLDLPTGL